MQEIARFAAAAISTIGYGGIVILMALESACLPVPSEVVMPLAGYLVSTGRFNLVLAATAGALGCNIGSTATYFAGRYGGRPLIERWGRYVFLPLSELDRLDRFFARFGPATVFLARVMPMLPAVVSFPAGAARMSLWKFELYTFAGTWIWCFLLAFAGFEFGVAWATNPLVRSAMHAIDTAVVVTVAGGLLWLAWKIWRNPQRKA